MFRRRPLTPLEKRLDYRFKAPALLELAFCHRSWSFEQGEGENNERLEFLGDAVLGVAAAGWLYERLPEEPEGELSKLKAQLVSRPALAGHARDLELGARLRLGVGEERSGGRDKDSLLADALEAVFGAVYLDGGLEPALAVVRPMLERAWDERGKSLHADAKTRLQEFTQARGWDLPTYEVAKEEGPDHQKAYSIECRVDGRLAGRGTGRSKKIAEQVAAAEAVAVLEVEPPGRVDGK